MLRKLGKDIAIYGSSDFIFRLIAFIVFPIYTYKFSVSEFGTLMLLIVTANIIRVFANGGINNSVQRFYWDEKTLRSDQPIIVTTGLFLQFGWGLLVVFSIYMLLNINVYVLERYQIPYYLMLLVLFNIIPEQIIQYCRDTIRLHFNPWKYTLLSFLQNLSGILLGVLLILVYGYGIEGYFIGLLVADIIVVPMALFSIKKDLLWRYSSNVAKELFAYGYPFIFAGLAYWIFESIDRWMLAEMVGNDEVGLYSLAYKIGGVLIFLNAAFGAAWSPMAIYIKRNEAEYKQMYSRILSYWYFLLGLMGSIIIIFSSEIVDIVAPGSYANAKPIVAPIVLGMAVFGTTQITVVGISLEKKTKILATIAWVVALVNIILNYFLIPWYGGMGAAIATLISYILLTLLYTIMTQRLHPIPIEWKKIIYTTTVIMITAIAVININTTFLDWKNIFAKIMVIILIGISATYFKIVDIGHIKSLLKR